MNEKDPLDELVVDAKELDRTRIATALRGRLALDESSSASVVLPRFDELASAQKVVALMLLRKVAVLLERASDDGITPATLAEETGIPGGSVRRILRELVDSRRASQAATGLYFLSGPQVGSAVESLTTDPGEPSNPTAVKKRRRKSGGVKRPSTAGGDGRSSRASPTRTNAATRKATRSPTMLVKELLENGFFDELKTLSEVQRRLKDTTGHQIPVTTLSPVFTRMLRSRSVDREQTTDGVYAYIARRS